MAFVGLAIATMMVVGVSTWGGPSAVSHAPALRPVFVSSESGALAPSASPPVFNVTFKEVGLPAHTAWSVAAGNPPVTHSNTSSHATGRILFQEPQGVLNFTIGAPTGWGVAKVTGATHPGQTSTVIAAATQVNVFFGPVESLTFHEAGLPSGTVWSVSIASVLPHGGPSAATSSGSGNSISFTVVEGTYHYTISSAAPYSGLPGHATVRVSDGPTTKFVRFQLVTAHVTFVSHNLTGGHSWTLNITGPAKVTMTSAAPIMKFVLPDGVYSYTIGPIAGLKATPSSGTFTVSGHVSMTIPISWSTG